MCNLFLKYICISNVLTECFIFISENQEVKKRKRTKNTTTTQYEIYLDVMERDYAFRSNTIDPTLPVDYIEKKWEELTNKLNSTGDGGPVISKDEWKKRFMDWKYATKAKIRKINAHRKKTGGGPDINLRMTDLEERALAVWGRVTVDGDENATQYEGIPIDTAASSSYKEPPPTQVDIIFIDELVQKEMPNEGNENKEKNEAIKKSKRVRSEKSFSAIAEQLIDITNNNANIQKECNQVLKTFCDNYVRIKSSKLDFEIKKFKYLHPDFTN
ncbi:hypothetical protein ABEB36_003429 [Hypothenemus hampei]|uniref:Regulatory protein zeste n=1 Tax=Hypothenemus hampei TaxID=57062 RepID=A0ABD1F954_HYPHA